MDMQTPKRYNKNEMSKSFLAQFQTSLFRNYNLSCTEKASREKSCLRCMVALLVQTIVARLGFNALQIIIFSRDGESNQKKEKELRSGNAGPHLSSVAAERTLDFAFWQDGSRWFRYISDYSE